MNSRLVSIALLFAALLAPAASAVAQTNCTDNLRICLLQAEEVWINTRATCITEDEQCIGDADSQLGRDIEKCEADHIACLAEADDNGDTNDIAVAGEDWDVDGLAAADDSWDTDGIEADDHWDTDGIEADDHLDSDGIEADDHWDTDGIENPDDQGDNDDIAIV